jgi:hypothetical protein
MHIKYKNNGDTQKAYNPLISRLPNKADTQHPVLPRESK